MLGGSNLQRDDTYAAIQAYSTALTVATQTTNQSWPEVRIPYFESLGGRFRGIAKANHSSLFVVVPQEDRNIYEAHMWKQHEDVMRESHMLAYGNLDNFRPEGYQRNISTTSANGLVPDGPRDVYFPVYQNSPPAPTYASMNWNVATSPLYERVVKLATDMKNETFSVSGEGVTGVRTMEPNPFDQYGRDQPEIHYFHSVLDRVEGDNTNVVGVIMLSVSLELFTSGLIPDDVQGLMVVFRSSCNQNYTYVIEGKQATYLGAEDLHEEEFEKYEINTNLTSHGSTAAATAPGQCFFTQVRESFCTLSALLTRIDSF